MTITFNDKAKAIALDKLKLAKIKVAVTTKLMKHFQTVKKLLSLKSNNYFFYKLV